MSVRARWLIKNIIVIKAKLSLTTAVKRQSSGLVWDCYRSLMVFLSQLFIILLTVSVASRKFGFQRFVRNELFEWEFCVVPQDTFHPSQDYEHVICYKKSLAFLSMAVASVMRKSQSIYNWLNSQPQN